MKNQMKDILLKSIEQLEKGGKTKKKVALNLKEILEDLEKVDFRKFGAPSVPLNPNYEKVFGEIDVEFRDSIFLIFYYRERREEILHGCYPYWEGCKELADLDMKLDLLKGLVYANVPGNGKFSLDGYIHIRKGWKIVKIDEEKKLRYEEQMILQEMLKTLIYGCMECATNLDLAKGLKGFNELIEEHFDINIENPDSEKFVKIVKNLFKLRIEKIYDFDAKYIIEGFNNILDGVDIPAKVKFVRERFKSSESFVIIIQT